MVDSGDVAEETDVVEAFELDPNFDYDNVVLTPKYTADEILQISRSRDNPVQLTVSFIIIGLCNDCFPSKSAVQNIGVVSELFM